MLCIGISEGSVRTLFCNVTVRSFRRMKENGQNLHASVLDRLIDNEPGVSHEPVQYRLLNIGQIKASVIRDLENLLNTRRQILAPPAECKEINKSLFVYGLGDFTSQNPRSPA